MDPSTSASRNARTLADTRTAASVPARTTRRARAGSREPSPGRRPAPACALAIAIALAFAATGAAAATHYSEATVTVEGGPHAGTHSLRVDDVGCELHKSPGRPTYFNDNFGVPGVKDPNKLSFVLVRIRNADGPGSPAHADFDASVTFGRAQGKPSTYYMSGTNDTTGRVGGPGKLAVKEDGDLARVSFDLQPEAGITVKGRLSCTIIRY